MRKLPWAAFALFATTFGVVSAFTACGSEAEVGAGGEDGGGDGSLQNADDSGNADDGSSNNGEPDGATCKLLGLSCTNSLECCTANCLVPDGGASGEAQTPLAPPSGTRQFAVQHSRLFVQFSPRSLHVAPSGSPLFDEPSSALPLS
ncbi:MAG TPA: hypothetical protein VM580_03505, partial [Labilithrix sp.]|nr:hypothetical protein [Labilithrix sp.]